MLYKECVKEALEYYKIGERDLFSDTHKKNVSRCRNVLFKAFLLSGKTSSWVGNYFNRDHSTVLHGVSSLSKEELDFAYYLFTKYENTDSCNEAIIKEKRINSFRVLYNEGHTLKQIGSKLKIDEEMIDKTFKMMKMKYRKKLVPDYKNYITKMIYC